MLNLKEESPSLGSLCFHAVHETVNLQRFDDIGNGSRMVYGDIERKRERERRVK